MSTIALVALGILLVGQLIIRVEQRRLSAQFDAAADEARQAIVLGQAVAANDRDLADRMASNSAAILQATDRIEEAAVVVASDLRAVIPNTVILEATNRIEAAAAEVATDLADSHDRAAAVTDGHPPGSPGAAADAAASGRKSE